jgi:hypothetical protein
MVIRLALFTRLIVLCLTVLLLAVPSAVSAAPLAQESSGAGAAVVLSLLGLVLIVIMAVVVVAAVALGLIGLGYRSIQDDGE